jgi:hypothetical protein
VAPWEKGRPHEGSYSTYVRHRDINTSHNDPFCCDHQHKGGWLLGPSSQAYCGGTDQPISSPIRTGNGSLSTGSPDERNGLASKRTHAAPAVKLGGSANMVV